MSEADIAQCHIRVCARFTEAVAAADGRWKHPSPCAGWDARAVLEHVIGFHDVLLLRPLRAKPDRPRDDPKLRWSVTVDALTQLFDRPRLFDEVVDVPAIGDSPAMQIDARRLLPTLSQEVLIHAWDLARAVDAYDRLDVDLCAFFLSRLSANPDAEFRSGMFGRPVLAPDLADPQSRLLARLGRDPGWHAEYLGT